MQKTTYASLVKFAYAIFPTKPRVGAAYFHCRNKHSRPCREMTTHVPSKNYNIISRTSKNYTALFLYNIIRYTPPVCVGFFTLLLLPASFKQNMHLELVFFVNGTEFLPHLTNQQHTRIIFSPIIITIVFNYLTTSFSVSQPRVCVWTFK